MSGVPVQGYQPPAGRPPLTGGLQQMNMINAYRQGAPMAQLEQMNPYTPRPAQILPPALSGGYSWASDPNNPTNKQPAMFSNLPTEFVQDGTGNGGTDAASGGGGGGGSK